MRQLVFIFSILFLTSTYAQTATDPAKNPDEMIKQFSLLHRDLMPKVAVADMFYGCNLSQEKQFSFKELIIDMDKDQLASKLIVCLGEDNLASDVALNFGIKACFIDQLSHLEETEQQKSLNQVNNALAKLSRAERQKSFTQCVNNQTLKYLSQ
ncbi:hypothetical protein AADZ86_18530 [Colwelliaceae bacterium BS250]